MQMTVRDGSVMVAGTCGRDPELKKTSNDNILCRVGLAVGKRNNGADQEETIWANVQAWGNLARLLATAHKGDPVFVIGRIRENEYQGKTYKNLVADFLSVARTDVLPEPVEEPPGDADGFQTYDDEEDVPF